MTKGDTMVASKLPVLEVSRPALALVDKVGYGESSVSFDRFREIADRPRTTVTRYLKQLTESWLILRVRQGEYAIPQRTRFGRLLVESNPYRRSALLYGDILESRDESPWAFACVPIRSSYPMEIDRAIPVLVPDERLKDSSRSRPYAEAIWYAFDPERTEMAEIETEAGDSAIEVPVLSPELSLAILMASLDPRYMQAAGEAADRLGIPLESIAQQAKHLSPQSPPLKAIRPNTVVFPEWLEAFWETAKSQHARHALDDFLPGGDHGSSGDPVKADA